VAQAAFFPARGPGRRAVLVLPQWNADQEGHVGLCKLLNRFGISALRLTLAYHGPRRPPGIERAEYHVSSNLGRTVHATRQSVIDARSCLDWLQQRGFSRLGILGTSLGSCVAFIAAAHDRRVEAGVFNHVSMHFSDVVWTGISTRHVRATIERSIGREALRSYWAPISPASYLDRLRGRDMRTLLIWARHDSTFLPEYSAQVVEGFRSRNLPYREFCLPCGHYTLGRFPFNWIDGLVMSRFLARNL
jgi:pimeloyl-ACP methyl ester carboxylesterase